MDQRVEHYLGHMQYFQSQEIQFCKNTIAILTKLAGLV